MCSQGQWVAGGTTLYVPAGNPAVSVSARLRRGVVLHVGGGVPRKVQRWGGCRKGEGASPVYRVIVGWWGACASVGVRVWSGSVAASGGTILLFVGVCSSSSVGPPYGGGLRLPYTVAVAVGGVVETTSYSDPPPGCGCRPWPVRKRRSISRGGRHVLGEGEFRVGRTGRLTQKRS